MAKIVEVPGVGNVEFPDNVPDADISRTIRLHTAEPEKKGPPEWAAWRMQRIHDLNDSAANPPEDKGFLRGLWDGINPFPMIGKIASDPEGPQVGLVHALGDVASSQIDQGRKAAAAWKNGDRTEAVGHAMAAALPLVGPAAADAGEMIGQGKTREGIGRAAAVLLPFGMHHALPAATEAVRPATAALAEKVAEIPQTYADSLRGKAVQQYSRVLAPATNANKLRAAEVVPGLIDKGVFAGSLKGLQKTAGAQISRLGQAIGNAWDNLPPGTSTEFQPIYDRLQGEIDSTHSVSDSNGKKIPAGPEAKRAISDIQKLQETLMDVAAPDPRTGTLMLPVEKARFLRQYFDGIAEAAGRSSGANLAADSTAQAHAIAADSIRGELAKDHPDIASLNKEFSFWKDVNEIVNSTLLRRQGQAPSLMARAAQAAGLAKFGVLGAGAVKLLQEATSSPAWGTVSAFLKDRLADAIAKGQPGPAEFYAKKIAAAVQAQTNQIAP